MFGKIKKVSRKNFIDLLDHNWLLNNWGCWSNGKKLLQQHFYKGFALKTVKTRKIRT